MTSTLPLTLTAALAALLLAGCGDETPAKPPEIRPVRTEIVGGASATPGQVYPGVVTARYTTELGFRVAGRITARKVDTGTVVRAGQTLATLDIQDFTLAAAAAQSQLEAARVEAQLARADLRRFAELRSKNFISQAELDRHRTAADAADARLLQALAASAQQDNQRDYTRLSAPHAGVITTISAEPGQVVAAGDPIATLARTDAVEVEIDIAESDLARLRTATALGVALWSAPDTRYPGQVREIAPAADARTRTYRARIAFDAPVAAAQLGMTANVTVAATANRGLSVPQTAVFRVASAPQVWLYDARAQKVRARAIRLGALQGDRLQVLAGLKTGDEVVTAGVHALTPDQTVRRAVTATSAQP